MIISKTLVGYNDINLIFDIYINPSFFHPPHFWRHEVSNFVGRCPENCFFCTSTSILIQLEKNLLINFDQVFKTSGEQLLWILQVTKSTPLWNNCLINQIIRNF